MRFIDTAGVRLRGELPIAPEVHGIAPDGRDHEQLPELITGWDGAQVLTLTHSAS